MRLIDADIVLTRIHESSSRHLNGQAKTACDRIVRNTPTANVEMVENWVPVTECLPEDEATVNFTFVANGIPYVGTGYVKGGRWYHDHGSPVLDRVVSWRENRKARLATKWIPVTERLPKVCDTYIVSGRMKYDYEKEYSYFVDAAVYNPADGWDTFHDNWEGQQDFAIIAWMPLPEPYEEEQD